jgi:hypothetical protein
VKYSPQEEMAPAIRLSMVIVRMYLFMLFIIIFLKSDIQAQYHASGHRDLTIIDALHQGVV